MASPDDGINVINKLIWKDSPAEQCVIPKTMDDFLPFVEFFSKKLLVFRSNDSRMCYKGVRPYLDASSNALNDCAEDLFTRFGGKSLNRIEWFTGDQPYSVPSYFLFFMHVINDNDSTSTILSFYVPKITNSMYDRSSHFRPVSERH